MWCYNFIIKGLMKFLLVLALAVALVASTRISMEEKAFRDWMMKHGKMYNTWEEFDTRMGHFMNNFMKVRSAHPNFDVRQAHEYYDMHEDEFNVRNGFKADLIERKNVRYLPESNDQKVDWRGSGAVTPVKNQGSCGSCWAFSSTGSLEAAYFQKHGSLKSFSEQELVDCSKNGGNAGCNGGLMDNAFTYWESNSEELESDYTYTGADGTCA